MGEDRGEQNIKASNLHKIIFFYFKFTIEYCFGAKYDVGFYFPSPHEKGDILLQHSLERPNKGKQQIIISSRLGKWNWRGDLKGKVVIRTQ